MFFLNSYFFAFIYPLLSNFMAKLLMQPEIRLRGSMPWMQWFNYSTASDYFVSNCPMMSEFMVSLHMEGLRRILSLITPEANLWCELQNLLAPIRCLKNSKIVEAKVYHFPLLIDLIHKSVCSFFTRSQKLLSLKYKLVSHKTKKNFNRFRFGK